jgi:hypothetical protein
MASWSKSSLSSMMMMSSASLLASFDEHLFSSASEISSVNSATLLRMIADTEKENSNGTSSDNKGSKNNKNNDSLVDMPEYYAAQLKSSADLPEENLDNLMTMTTMTNSSKKHMSISSEGQGEEVGGAGGKREDNLMRHPETCFPTTVVTTTIVSSNMQPIVQAEFRDSLTISNERQVSVEIVNLDELDHANVDDMSSFVLPHDASFSPNHIVEHANTNNNFYAEEASRISREESVGIPMLYINTHTAITPTAEPLPQITRGCSLIIAQPSCSGNKSMPYPDTSEQLRAAADRLTRMMKLSTSSRSAVNRHGGFLQQLPGTPTSRIHTNFSDPHLLISLTL